MSLSTIPIQTVDGHPCQKESESPKYRGVILARAIEIVLREAVLTASDCIFAMRVTPTTFYRLRLALPIHRASKFEHYMRVLARVRLRAVA